MNQSTQQTVTATQMLLPPNVVTATNRRTVRSWPISGFYPEFLWSAQVNSRLSLTRSNWRDLCEVMLFGSEVSYGEVLEDKSTLYIMATLYWGYLIVLWLFHLVRILCCGCFDWVCNVWVWVCVCVCVCNVWLCVCVGFVMCGCVWGFCNVWVFW